MKLIINYDFIKEVYNARDNFTLSKSFFNNLPSNIKFIPFAIGISALYGGDLSIASQASVVGFGLISAGDVLTDAIFYKIYGEDVYQMTASKRLKKLVGELEDLNVRTDYDSLLESELYEKHYKVDVNEGILPRLVEEKYVLVPGHFFRGDKEDISILQEHVVGSKEYVLSLGSPSKKTSKRLANSFS